MAYVYIKSTYGFSVMIWRAPLVGLYLKTAGLG